MEVMVAEKDKPVELTDQQLDNLSDALGLPPIGGNKPAKKTAARDGQSNSTSKPPKSGQEKS